ncbi:helix-turn-helix transcriptional regulator [Halovenus salina]|uniref:Helix-turn-helix transcriptional regulator n=1 Tax=Halovenus salina TaxID=1510225 RepID=A0ABD5W1K3_9EURY|nr:hypothetical protein [Halovenus salina]
MSRTRWTAVLGVVVFAVVCLGVAAVVGTAGASDAPEGTLFQTDIDADTTRMAATVDTDGDTEWQVTYRLDLGDDESVQAFEDLQTEIRANESVYLDPFADRIRRTAESAATTTNRAMSVENVSMTTERTTQPDAEFGEIIFSFAWTGFAAVDDGTVRAGDALDGLVLDEGTSFTLRWPDELRLDSQRPQAETVTGQQLTWRGPLEFGTGEPRAVLVPASEDGSSAVSTPILVVGVVVAIVGVGLAVYLRRGESESTATAEEAAAGSRPKQETGPPSELLSNEERVLALVEDNGGRIKQKEVAERLDWSAAMTSQVVGDLREAEKIETFRIGRENVLTLPDVDIVPDDDTAEGGPDDEQ